MHQVGQVHLMHPKPARCQLRCVCSVTCNANTRRVPFVPQPSGGPRRAPATACPGHAAANVSPAAAMAAERRAPAGRQGALWDRSTAVGSARLLRPALRFPCERWWSRPQTMAAAVPRLNSIRAEIKRAMQIRDASRIDIQRDFQN